VEDKEEILVSLMEAIGEEGCGVSCEGGEVFQDEEGWRMSMEDFMGPQFLAKTGSEAKASIRGYASMGFGLS
jgi:hypothetical protein